MAHRWFIERGRLCLAVMLLVLTAVLAFGSLYMVGTIRATVAAHQGKK